MSKKSPLYFWVRQNQKTNKMALEQEIAVAEAPETGAAAIAPETQQGAEVQTAANPDVIVNGENNNAAPVAETQVATQSAAPAEQNEDEILNAILAKKGIAIEDLQSIQAAKEKEREEKEAPIRAQKEWGQIVQFGIENGIISKDDVVAYETLSKVNDKDLVFEQFKANYKNEEGLTGEELEEAITAEFEDEYNLATTSQRALARAEAALKAEADRIRNEKASVFSKAQSQYNQVKTVKNLREQHDQILKQFEDGVVEKKEFEVEIEGEKTKLEIEIPIKVDAAAVKEQIKAAADGAILNVMYDTYQKNPEAAAEMFKEFAKSTAISQEVYAKALVDAAAAKLDTIYKQKYTVGSRAPFQSTSHTPEMAGAKTELEAYRQFKK